MDTNLRNFALRNPRLGVELSVHTLMIDDVNCEERSRPSPYDNIVRGYARENDFTGISLKADSFLNLQLLDSREREALKPLAEQSETEPKLKLSREITGFAIGAPNCETGYAPSFVAAHGTAVKGSKAADMTPSILTILEAWKAAGANESHGWIVTIQKDGAAIMNQAVHGLMTAFTIDRNSPIGLALFSPDGKGMLLFCDLCGRSSTRPLVDGVDLKHVGKRFRMALKRKEGIRIFSFTFNRHLISRMLVELGFTEISVKNMWGEADADAQNVEAVTKLLRAIASFRKCKVLDFHEKRRAVLTFPAQLKELKILAEYSACLFEVITGQSADPDVSGFLPLSSLTRSADTLSHLAFVLFRQNGTAFVPAQHYYNTQIMLRAPHISIATCQADGIALFFWYAAALSQLPT